MRMYIKGLHTLRFLAAMMVLIYHCNGALAQVQPDLWRSYPILMKGNHAVDFFFILSGFLLTILALREIENTGSFHIRRFFKRRLLRIAPLYYLVAIMGLILFGIIYPRIIGEPFFDFPLWKGVLYYLLFLPNFVVAQWSQIGPLYSLWSIGVEEHFYLLFPFVIVPLVMKRSGGYLLSLLLVLYFAFYLAIDMDLISSSGAIKRLVTETYRLHFILLGCLTGYLIFHQRDNLLFQIIGRPAIQVITVIGLVTSLFFIPVTQDPHNIIAASLVAIVIINCARDVSILPLEFQPAVYLGMISYGIYVFHPYVSIGLRYTMDHNDSFQGLMVSHVLLFYALVALITFGTAHLSYRYFEGYFLRMKG